MPRKQPVILRAAIGNSIEVDREAGIIRNVAVITLGTTKPSAGGQTFDIDATALQQVADAINTSEVGVKSRLTHPEIEGVDDLPLRLGYIRNARVEGNSVRADFHAHNPLDGEVIRLMSIAETDPASCGMSIVDLDAALVPSPGTPTGIVLRVETIDAVDWVGEPAANPTGMLSTKRQRIYQGASAMNAKQMEYLHTNGLPADASEEQVAAFVEALSEEQKAQLAALADTPAVEPDAEDVALEEGTTPEEEKKPTAMSAKVDAKAINEAVMLAQRNERARVREIQAIALKVGQDDKWAAKYIDAGTEVGEVRRIALNSIKREPKDMQTSTVAVGADLNRDSLNQAVQDAILLRANTRQFVKYDETGQVMLSADNRPVTRKAHDRAADFRGHSIIEMGRRYLVSLGYREADRMQKPQLAALLMNKNLLASKLGGVFLAQATGDFPYLLADAMGKVLRGEYALSPHTWSLWCRKTTAPDFKTIKAIQLSEAADLQVIPEGDEYKYASLTEGQETYALRTQGRGLKFTRQMLINDDTSAFDRAPRLMGRAAARAVEAEAISILTANAALADGFDLFGSDHSNTTTGALTVASLGAARSKLRRQTALGSTDPLELTPRYLLVPETIAATAEQLVGSSVDPAKQNNTPNLAFIQGLAVISSARLDTDSTTEWYLLADPSEIDTVEVAFLEGEETPVVEEEDEFDTDARKVKVRHTFRAKAIDYRGMVRSTGS